MGLDWGDFDLGVPPRCPTSLPVLPDVHLTKQNQADSGTAKTNSTQSSLEPDVPPCTSFLLKETNGPFEMIRSSHHQSGCDCEPSIHSMPKKEKMSKYVDGLCIQTIIVLLNQMPNYFDYVQCTEQQ